MTPTAIRSEPVMIASGSGPAFRMWSAAGGWRGGQAGSPATSGAAAVIQGFQSRMPVWVVEAALGVVFYRFARVGGCDAPAGRLALSAAGLQDQAGNGFWLVGRPSRAGPLTGTLVDEFASSVVGRITSRWARTP